MGELRHGRRRAGKLVEMLEKRELMSASIARPSTDAFPAGSVAPPGFSPAQIRHAYGFDSIKFSGIIGDGSGQTIAIVTAFDDPAFVSSTSSAFNSSDLHQFDAYFGIADPPSFKKVNQTGGSVMPPSAADWADETSLDVEWAHALAPKANILLVEASSSSFDDLLGGAVDYARRQPGVSVVSMSFGAPEGSFNGSYDSFLSTPGGHAGITFVAASGDRGAPGQYPASSPNVVAVGGTSLTLSGSNYQSETGASGSGGGASTFEPRPGYQVSVNSSSKRTIPDVSFDGDPQTGVSVYDSFNGGPNPWYKVGGTSLGTPAWAALIATANQGRAMAGLSSLDGASQTLPRLYQIDRNDYHDILTGSNGFTANSGYDLVTGLGTPKANLLAADIGGLATISGTVKGIGGAGLSNVTVYIDVNNKGSYVTSDPHVVTDSSGNYTFKDIWGGKYIVREVVPKDYKQTTPGGNAPVTISLASGQQLTNQNFNNTSTLVNGSISGNLFNDLSGDGARQAGEPNLSGRIMFVDLNHNGKPDPGEATAKTDSNGNYKLNNLPPNQLLRIREYFPSGWRPSLPSAWFYDLKLSSGQNLTNVNFGDTVKIYIGGTIFNDINSDGKQETGEAGLSGFRVFVDANDDGKWQSTEASVLTDVQGKWGFFGLNAGTYHIRVATDTRYKQTSPSGNVYTFTLLSGQLALNKQIGEHRF